MTFQTDWTGRGVEEYYQKFIELQERLRKSEEERLQLEMKFNTMIQVTQEEEQLYFKRLKTQYKRFMEENQKRQERNQQLLAMLERIEGRAAIFEAKSKRFKLLRNQYHSFLNRIENERRLDVLEGKKVVETDPTLSVLIDHQLPKALGGVQIREVREHAKPMQQWPPDLGTATGAADQLLSRFKEQSNEAQIADDILRSIYARNRKRIDLSARRVTIEDDTDDSSTSVVAGAGNASGFSQKMHNGHVPNGKVNSKRETYSSSEVLDEIEGINRDGMLNNAAELMENCDINKNVDVNQNTLNAISPEEQNKVKTLTTQNGEEVLGAEMAENVEKKHNGIPNKEIKETALQHENNIEDKMATETKADANGFNDKIGDPIPDSQTNHENGKLENKPNTIPLEIQQEQEQQAENAENINQEYHKATELLQQQEQVQLLENIGNVTNEHPEYQQYSESQEYVAQEQQNEQNIQDPNVEPNYQDPNLNLNLTNNTNQDDQAPASSNVEQTYEDTNIEQVEQQPYEDPNQQYDESGQPIHYDANGQQIYYDDNGQAMHYDANTQEYKYNEQQYDENGQATNYQQNYSNYQYDENGQVVDYAQQGEGGEANVYYDENGQPVAYPQQSQQEGDHDQEATQAAQGDHGGIEPPATGTTEEQQAYYDENAEYEHEGQNDQYDQQQQHQQQEHGEVGLQLIDTGDGQQMAAQEAVNARSGHGESAGHDEDAPKANVMEFLDTESESTHHQEQEQEQSKGANESDFDFSSTSEAKLN